MVRFKVDYSLSYYDSRSYRVILNDKSKSFRLMDSYSTTMFVVDYSELVSYESYCIGVEREKLELIDVGLASNEHFLFFRDKETYDKVKKTFCDGEVDLSDFRTKEFALIINQLIKQKNNLHYIVQISNSQFEKCMNNIREICDAT